MNRPDFSEYVAHFTRPNCDRLKWADVPNNRREEAYNNLVSMLSDRKINAGRMPWTNKNAVCLTECPWWSLLDHAQRYSPYAVGFKKSRVFAKGGAPAIYLRPDLHAKQYHNFIHIDRDDMHGFHEDVYAFVTPISLHDAPSKAKACCEAELGVPFLDYSHEREWRVPGDFGFTLGQVEFVIVDTYEDVAKFPQDLKDAIGRQKFLMMDMYRKIEELWPTHRVD